MERPTLRQLEYALALAEHRHFGKAAAACHVSQPGLSNQIRELEQRLGVTLFERARPEVLTTEAGRDLVDRAQRVLRDVDELMAGVSGSDVLAGELRITVIPTVAPYLLPTVVRRLRTSAPALDLRLTERVTGGLLGSIEEGGADLGVLAMPYGIRSLDHAWFADDPFVLVVPEGHELADRAGPLPSDVLADQQVLLLEEGHCLRDHARAICAVAGSPEHQDVVEASMTTLAQMVAGGAGVTLLPLSAVAVECRPGSGLVARPLAAGDAGRTLHLVWRPSDPRAGVYRNLAEELAEAAADVLAAGRALVVD